MKTKELLAEQIRLRDYALERWHRIIEEIKNNPNKTNIRGIWIEDMLRTLFHLHFEVLMRDGFIDELKRK